MWIRKLTRKGKTNYYLIQSYVKNGQTAHKYLACLGSYKDPKKAIDVKRKKIAQLKRDLKGIEQYIINQTSRNYTNEADKTVIAL
jgi:hypothetical protein